jgi:pyruvate/2-oxoglutarate/acetoin dehydrogenase E1 component
MVAMVMDVVNQLEAKKISTEVIDLRCLEPLDMDTIITSVKKTGRVVIVDEDVSRCGVTGEIGMQIMEKAFNYLSSPIKRVAAKNIPIPAGYLEKEVLPKAQDIANAIGLVLGMKENLPVEDTKLTLGFKVV